MCYEMYNKNTWFSYTHNRFYCNLPHPSDKTDLLESFKTQVELLIHMKLKHDMVVDLKIVPHKSKCLIE